MALPVPAKRRPWCRAIKTLVQREHRQILVVAPSNAAVDLLSEKLADEGLNVLRAGNPARISQRLLSLTLDSKTAEDSRMKEIKKLKKQANAFKDMAHKYKRNFGKAEREQRKALFDEARKIMKEVEQTEQYIQDNLIKEAQVITATLVGANHYSIRNLKFHTVVIDEAGAGIGTSLLDTDTQSGKGDYGRRSLPVTPYHQIVRSGQARTQPYLDGTLRCPASRIGSDARRTVPYAC